MKKRETNNNKYSNLRGLAPRVAQECNCDPDYVRKVFRGERIAKTDRAVKIQHIYSVADRILKSFNPQDN